MAIAELPFEAEPDIDADQQHRGQCRQQAVAQQFGAHLRADGLGAANLEVCRQQGLYGGNRPFLGCRVTHWFLQADQQILAAAGALQRNFTQAEAGQACAQGGEVVGLGGLRLDKQASGEVNAEVQSPGAEGGKGGEGEQEGEGKSEATPAHERIARVVGNKSQEAHDGMPWPKLESRAARWG